jgi:hypothetical protein
LEEYLPDRRKGSRFAKGLSGIPARVMALHHAGQQTINRNCRLKGRQEIKRSKTLKTDLKWKQKTKPGSSLFPAKKEAWAKALLRPL